MIDRTALRRDTARRCAPARVLALSITLLMAGCGGGDGANPAAAATAASPTAASSGVPVSSPTAAAAAAAAAASPSPDDAGAASTAVAAATAVTAADEPGVARPAAAAAVRTPARSSGVLLLRIDGPVAGVSHDTLNVAGSADLSGTLRLEFADDYTPSPGQRFTVVTAARGIAFLHLVVSSNKALPLVVSQDDQHVYVTVAN